MLGMMNLEIIMIKQDNQQNQLMKIMMKKKKNLKIITIKIVILIINKLIN